ncbi:MAG: Sensory box/GGDEF family protein [Frankiales bacterium]|jgi:diguanylate cyclase (GGDEF)-like protein/PAS domain S-box-containing protein|nr:Sensory box/GGDEF family protein [Frankiales bacterium]
MTLGGMTVAGHPSDQGPGRPFQDGSTEGTRRALEASERRYRSRYEDVPLPQAVISPEGQILSANPAFCRLVDSDEVVGRSILDLRHASDSASPADWLAGVGADQPHEHIWERVVAQRDGTPVPVLVYGALLTDEEGRPEALSVFIQDLTRLRQAERALSRGEALRQALGQQASDWAVLLDAEGRMLHVSYSSANALGHDSDKVLGDVGFTYLHPDDEEPVRQAFQAVLDEPERSQTVLLRIRNAAGEYRWAEEVLTNRLADPDIAGIVCNAKDVTARVQAEQALRESEARYRAIAETAQEGIWGMTPAGQTFFANQKLAEILGVSVEALYATAAMDVLAPEEPQPMVDRLRRRHERGPEAYEIAYAHPDGSRRVLAVSASPLTGEEGMVGSLAMISDVTAARLAEEELRRRALYDDLTGLANRTLLTDRLDQALARRSRRPGGSLAVLFADLDQFKLVNDSWGHAAGDRLLIAVAHRLSAAVRPGDTVARFGGDEFVVVADDADEAEAGALAERLLTALAEPFDIEGNRVYVSASVGITASESESSEELLRFADAAMYHAKSRGRGRVQVFDVAIADDAANRLVIGNDLREAIAGEQLDLHYQPFVDLTNGQVVGVEALTRWHHPTRGDMSPPAFVAVAESLGLAPAFDSWALTRACRELPDLRRALGASVRVSVNVSARHLSEGNLEDTVGEALRRGGETGAGLNLEITEGAVMDDPDRARGILQRLAERGVTASIDDFGTGHSSLAYLSWLPVASLKIDRSFVENMTRDADSLAIVASIIDLARTLRLTSIAEGVETPEQLALLRRLGCMWGQGFLWSPALPLQSLEDLVAGLPHRKFDLTPVNADGPPAGRREQVTAEHGLHRLMALHREGASLTTIAAALNAEGFQTPRGLRWHRSTVARVVSELAYPTLWQQGTAR